MSHGVSHIVDESSESRNESDNGVTVLCGLEWAA